MGGAIPFGLIGEPPMAKFFVKITRTIVETVEVVVCADDEGHARVIATVGPHDWLKHKEQVVSVEFGREVIQEDVEVSR